MFIQVSIITSSGDRAGKSDLILRFVTGRYTRNYDPVVEDFYQKEVDIDGGPCLLEIIDTADPDQFMSVRELHFKSAQGFILVFAIDNAESFTHCMVTRGMICRVKGSEDVPIICELQ